ncbi:MAG: DUF2207 domain-containing protein [Candidatus Micrarchaeota archaeon]|nr:DUF2207 domain-containing protein [Candidatus Micrarchaeota archaeon]
MGKSLFASFFILLLLLPFAYAKEYSIPNAEVYYSLQHDGSVQVQERITYSLSGDFHELYLQKPTDLQIRDSSGYCEGRGSCTFRTQYNEGYHELVLADNFGSGTVTVVFKYTIDGEILEQQDSAQFFYKLWGDTWSQPVGELSAYVIAPQGVEIADGAYFFHSQNQLNVQLEGSQLIAMSSNHPANTYLEVNVLLPKEAFANLRRAPNYMTRQQIMDGEKNYLAGQAWQQQIGLMLSILVLLLPVAGMAAFAYIYYRRQH